MGNPLVAQAQSSTTAYSGVSLLESAHDLNSAIQSGDWASVAMGSVGTALDALSMAMDPFGAILAAGVGWLMEHIGPLKSALDALAGNPDQIKANSETWANIAKELGSIGDDLKTMSTNDTASWTGEAGDAYRQRAADLANLMGSAKEGSEGASSGVKTAGEVVAAVRSLVRDIIAELVGHMISWALQVIFTLGIGLTWVVPQVVAAVAKTASQIASITTKLVKALKALVPLLKKAGDLFADAAKALKNIKPGKGAPAAKPGDLPPGPKGGGTPKGGDGSTTPSGKTPDPTPPPKTDPPPPPKTDPAPPPKSDPDGGPTTPSSAKPDPTPPPKTDPAPPPKTPDNGSTNPSGSPDTTPGGGTPKGGAGGKGPDGDTTPAGANKPNPPRDGAVGADDLVCKSDPVDIARGNVVMAQVDLELPSPLTLDRLHISSYRAGNWFGPQWTSTMDQRLEFDPEHVCYFSPDGMILVYPHPGRGNSVLPLEGPRRPLTWTEDGTYTLADPARGTELRFGRLPGRGGAVLPLLAAVDRFGEWFEVDYDTLGAPQLLRHSAGYRVELETDAGRVTTITVLDPTNDNSVLVRRFGYDDRGRLAQVVNSSGVPEQFDYDTDGRMTGWQDRNGTWYRYIYDADGRCVRTVGDRGFYDGEFTYDTERRVTTFADSLGHTTEFHLNEAAQVVREIGPLGETTVSGWDRYDRLLSRTDPLGRTTGYEYSDNGLLTAVIRPDGSRAGVELGPDGSLTVTVVSGDRTWQRVYPAGTAPDLFTGQGGIEAKFDLDRQWTAGASPVPAEDPVERDLFGRPRVVTDTSGGRTRLGWTVEGLRASRTGPSGRHEEWRYDAEGNIIEENGTPGRRTRYEYGPFNLPVASIDPTGARTTYEYDTELRLTRVTNPAGLTWSYTYDAAGRTVSETDFDGRVLQFGYDAAGRLVRSVDGLGAITTYTYDPLGNVLERRTATGTTTYAYDPVGMLVRAISADSVLEIERDGLGRVVRESVDGRAVSYSYDEHSVIRRTPSGVDSAWTFDGDGNPASLSVSGQVVSFRYDQEGREVERKIGEGTVLAQAFDAEHQLIGQTVTALAGNRVVQQRQYRYQVDGQLTGVDDVLSGPSRYRVDAAGRVTGVATHDGEENYHYDASGNIAHAQTPPAEPDAGPRGYAGNLLSAAGSVRYTHDRQGRLIARQEGNRTWTYGWDAQDRLIGVRTPEGTEWRYRYDPLGRRIAKQQWVPNGPSGPVLADEVLFVWSGQLLVEQVRRGRDGQQLVTTWDHVPGSVRPVTQTEQLGAGVRFFSFLTDQIGTPVDMVDANGVVAWHASSSLWGKVKPGHTGVSTPLRFPGQYADDETGLHYNVFRYYDPGTGRYLSQDPLGLVPAPNPVTYVPNPLRDSDPLGLGCGQSKHTGETPTPNRPVGGDDAANVQSSNPTSKPPATSKPPETSKPDNGEGPSTKPDETPPPKPKPEDAFNNKVDDYKQQLGIDGPVKTLNVPDDPKIKLNTPVSELPPGVANNLGPGDQNKLVGELMGYKKDDILGDPEFGNFKAHDALDMQGGGGYNHDSGVINIQSGANDKTLFHEMGHVKQNENGFNHANTNQSVLEYHNVLLNENKMDGPLRDNYMHGDIPGSQKGKNSWDDLQNNINNLPDSDPKKAGTQNALNQIDDVLRQDPRYAGKADVIKQNLVDEFFRK